MKKLAFAILIAVAALSLAGKELPPSLDISSNDNRLHVYFLDVGQADSTFIITPDGESILIDAGNAEDGERIVKLLKSAGIKRLDYLIATHPHADHIGGMEDVVKSFDIGDLYMTNAQTNSRTFENLLLAIKEKNEPILRASSGTLLFEKDGISASFVAPNADSYEDLNNYSAVLKLTYGQTSFLFTGDAEKTSEDQIRSNIKCDVLKVGHHGSSSSTTKNFLKKTEPKYAVISCGEDNSYGHPHTETLQRLNSRSIKTYRTDLNGTIEAISDGVNIEFNTERE